MRAAAIAVYTILTYTGTPATAQMPDVPADEVVDAPGLGLVDTTDLHINATIGSRQPADLSRLPPVPEHPGRSTLTIMTPIPLPGDLVAEPSIAADRLNPAVVVVGVIDRTHNTVDLATSTTGGASFPILTDIADLTGSYPNSADPVVRADSQTTFYFVGVGFTDACTSATPNAIVMTKSNGGMSWNPLTLVHSNPNGGTVFHDKPWMAIDHWSGTPDLGRIWVNWNKYSIPCPTYGTPQIQTSIDGGTTWTAPVSIFQPSADDSAAWPGEVVALSDGTALTAYMGQPIPGSYLVRVIKCTPTSCSLVASLPAVAIPDNSYRFQNLSGMRSNSFPELALNDLPNGNANVLLVWTDIRTGLGQTRFGVSTSGGQGFQVQGVVDSTATTDQFFPSPGWWVDSQGNSTAVVCYYQRVNETSRLINYKCARSTNNGSSWTRVTMTATPFNLLFSFGAFIGDYTDYDGFIKETTYTISNLVSPTRFEEYVQVQSFQ